MTQIRTRVIIYLRFTLNIKISKKSLTEVEKLENLFSTITSYIGTMFIALATMLMAAIPSTTASEIACFDAQEVRVEALAEAYESGEAEKVDEQYFCSFDLDEADQYLFNDLQLIGTHNSYKLYQTELCYQISSLVFPLAGEDSDAMNYEHDDLTTQLNMGLRTFEWDIVSYDGEFDGFLIQHEAYIDALSSTPNLELALEELVMWSDYNEDHIPLIIMIECKEITLPSADKDEVDTAEEILELSELISEVLGDKFYTPSDLIGDYDSMTALREDNGYPTIDDLLGKIIIVLHPGTACTDYGENVAFEDQDIFVGDIEDENACFAVVSGAYSVTINAITNGYITRSYTGAWLSYSPDEEQKYISFGSNIISSDYVDEDKFDTVSRFANGYTISVREIN